MNYIKKSMLMTALALMLATGIMYTPAQAKTTSKKVTASVASAKKKAARAKSSKAQKKKNLDNWLAACSKVGKNLSKYGFRHSTSASGHSFQAALKGSRTCNCSMYASWCLQEYGILKKGQVFYPKENGAPSRKSWDKSKVQLIKVYKKCKKIKLKPGDVVCRVGGHHAAIYAGKNSKGQLTWFDAGRHSTRGKYTGSRYAVVKPSLNRDLEGRTIGYIIRIKGL